MGWITDKLRAGRYSMNLQLLEADLTAASSLHRATVMATAVNMIEKMQADDFITGSLLDRVVMEPFGTSEDVAQGFYNTLEDVLNAAEKQRKQILQHTISRLGADAAKDMDRRAQTHQQGIRLLMVVLARKADPQFKTKTRKIKELLFDAGSEIDAAVNVFEREHKALASVAPDTTARDFGAFRQSVKAFSFTLLGW